jgi:hypothetical protein
LPACFLLVAVLAEAWKRALFAIAQHVFENVLSLGARDVPAENESFTKTNWVKKLFLWSRPSGWLASSER